MQKYESLNILKKILSDICLTSVIRRFLGYCRHVFGAVQMQLSKKSISLYMTIKEYA